MLLVLTRIKLPPFKNLYPQLKNYLHKVFFFNFGLWQHLKKTIMLCVSFALTSANTWGNSCMLIYQQQVIQWFTSFRTQNTPQTGDYTSTKLRDLDRSRLFYHHWPQQEATQVVCEIVQTRKSIGYHLYSQG